MYIRLYPYTSCIFIDHLGLTTPLLNLLVLRFETVEFYEESGLSNTRY